jgi:hypothetical protein
MSRSFEKSAPCPEHSEELDLCTRVRAEFREMPGLKLTLPQASRLFSIDPARCERVLGALVHAGHLATDGRAFANPLGGRRSA